MTGQAGRESVVRRDREPRARRDRLRGPAAPDRPSRTGWTGSAVAPGRSRTHRIRAIGRRILGTLLLSGATVVVVLAACGAAVYTLLSAPWRPRLGRARRAVAIAAVYCATEIAGLGVAAWRWVRYTLDRGAARDLRDRRHRTRSLIRSLDTLRAATQRFGGLRVEQDPDTPPLPAGPLIVCGRHGGIGGAFLLAHILLADHGRLPRVVLKRTLSWDPLIDALLSRIPHAFIDPRPGDDGATAGRIGALARGMTADDAVLIFPEGGNFTPRRRMHAIHRLRRRGLTEAAAHAERLRNVLPPHPDGLLAALDAAPRSQVVFVAHTGLEHMQSAADLWRRLPLRAPVRLTWWAVPVAGIPGEARARIGWLEENWSRIDAWVARQSR